MQPIIERADAPVQHTEQVEEMLGRPGEPVRIERSLQRVRAPVAQAPNGQGKGVVKIHLETWADVYLGDQRIGRAPGEFSLPVGRHRLRLHNPYSQRTWNLPVAVAADQPSYYRVPE